MLASARPTLASALRCAGQCNQVVPALRTSHPTACTSRGQWRAFNVLKSSLDGTELYREFDGDRVVLSTSRLEQFLEAEVTHFAGMKRNPLTLTDLLQDAASPHRAAMHVREEIPKHFAARLRQIEQLPDWSRDPDLKDLHRRYQLSFQEMRMTDELSCDISEFPAVIRKLKQRQRKALPLLGNATRRLSQRTGFSKEFWNPWINKFLTSRISTEMLTSQYLAIVNQVEQGRTAITGIVDPECDPAAVCENVVAAAKQLTLSNTGVEVSVQIENRSKRSHSFSYIPIYLHYILLELLKNACYATARAVINSSVADPASVKAVKIVISSDDHRVAMRVSDLAGGIPFDVGDLVWDFLYSGWGDNQHATPLSGYGLGLPLARLYAEYLGGTLSLVSLPEFGVDAYLFLPRISITPSSSELHKIQVP